MGSNARIHIFDYVAFTDEIVPAVHKLLLTGEYEPLLARVRDHGMWDGLPWPRFGGADLLKDCTLLTEDLAYKRGIEMDEPWFAGWDDRACESEVCASRKVCPFHQDRVDLAEVNRLIRYAIAERCLEQEQFVGRTVNVGYYRDLLEALNVPESSPIRSLLWLLGTRGFLIGYAFGNSDGIHGWLDPAETWELQQLLSELDLPHYEESFEAMNDLHRRCNSGEPGTPDWPAVSLSFVRTVASIAQRRGRGILWGNDVYPLSDLDI